jgi:APA family basic amino acid/polyamine antiporter
VGTAALEQIFHSGGAYLMAAAILISTFGCANGMTLAGARVYYAMSRDGLFFKSVGKLHPRYKTPVAGLLVQAAWATLLCISGSYSQLLDYIIFAVLVFYILTIVGCLCCASSGRMRRGPTRRWAIRCCRRSIS